jgi:putative transposase
VGLARSTARYSSRPRPRDSELAERLRALAVQHPRFGYRRIGVLLRRAGERVNAKRVYRLWQREGLSIKRSIKKQRRVGSPQERAIAAQRPNGVWTVDFLEDRTVSGQKLRLLTVTDEFTRESLAIEVGRSLPAEKVAATLERVIGERGTAPAYLRSDNGPEFLAQGLQGCLQRAGVQTAYIEKGKPWQNGYAESFHSRFRDEFLNGEVFLSIVDARVRVGVWRRWYNEERPHSSLEYQTPQEFAAGWQASQGEAAGTNISLGS